MTAPTPTPTPNPKLSKLRAMLARKKAENLSLTDNVSFGVTLIPNHVAAALLTPVSDPKMNVLDVALDTGTLIPTTNITLAPGSIDPRLKLLSHSSRTTLHSCPRKYQLYRLSSNQIALEEKKGIEQGVTFAYGKAVGVGVQSALEGKTEDQVILDTFMEWDVDLLDSNPRQHKSFWLAVRAVQKIMSLLADGFLAEYELVYYKGKPAVELSFIINLPDGYKYRGYVDAVLQHKQSKEVLVLENKTTSGSANSATFKNSGQALGYSVVLDILFPEMSSYEVLYLVYETKTMEFVELPFTKSLLQRALWLQELLIDTKMISMYDSYGSYPMHGESCYAWFRDCEYLSLCTLTTENITKPLTQDILDKIAIDAESYDFTLDFHDLVASQAAKGLGA